MILISVSIILNCHEMLQCAGALTKDPRKKDAPRKQHAKRIQCDVCHHMSKNLYDALVVNAKNTKRSEEDVIEYVERSTTAWRPEGEWMTHLHLSKSWKGLLSVKDMKRMGECGEACRTIEYTAQNVMAEYDADIGEALYTKSFGDSLDDFDAWMCVTKTRACVGKDSHAVPVEDPFVPYPAFKAKDPEEQNIERVLGEMADQGLRGNMFTREEAMEKYMMEAGLGDQHYDL